jgi:hypothetical protein
MRKLIVTIIHIKSNSIQFLVAEQNQHGEMYGMKNTAPLMTH